MCRKVALGNADNAVGRGVLLQTAPLAAAAGLRVVIEHGHMPQLSGCAVDTCQNLAVDNDTAAHAGAQRDHDDIAVALAAALPHLAQSRHIGVVASLGLHPGEGMQALLHIKYIPAQIDALEHRAVRAHGAGHADANAFHIQLGNVPLIQLVLHCLGNVRQDVGAVGLGTGGDFPAIQQISVGGEQPHLDGGAANVYAKRIGLHHGLTPVSDFSPPLKETEVAEVFC